MASDSGTLKAGSGSPETTPSMLDYRSRRDSLNSVSASSQIEKEQFAMALDKIHTSASQSDALTTFNDFAPPPGNVPVVESKGNAGDLVQQGLSGLYSRFREAVGVGKAVQEVDDDAQEATFKNGSNMSTAGKASVSSMARGESGATSASFNSSISSDVPTSAVSSSGIATTESQSQLPQSSKASSITTMTASKTTVNNSIQNLPKIVKASAPTAANPTVAPITVSAIPSARESSRGLTTRVEEPQSRSSKKSTSRPPEGTPSLNLSTNVSLDSVTISERNPTSILTRREDVLSVDDSIDSPISPVKSSNDNRPPSSASRVASGELLKKPAVIDRISFSRNSNRSRSSSMEPGVAEPSPISTSAHNAVHHDSFAHNERPQRLDSGALRIPGTTTNQGAPEIVNARLESMRKQVLSKEFWMADDTCKECWSCGTQFSAFRRKHHCRTCGCIFDSKCTSIISGQKFGVQGSLRVCKTCLDIINRRYDSGSDDSADESFVANMFRPNQVKTSRTTLPVRPDEDTSLADRSEQIDDTRSAATPMMAIPATRRVGVGGDANRQSAILEIDMMPVLSRPSSSRSLKSLASGRPQSSGHRRPLSKHNFLGRFKPQIEDQAPFRSSAKEELAGKSKLPAFHDDNIIDPDLAPYMSDESSGDEQMNIFTAMSGDVQPSSLDPDRQNFGPFINSGRKHRLRQGEKSVSGLSFTSRVHEEPPAHPNIALHSRPNRRRNLSTASASVHHLRSPRPKSVIFKGPSVSTEALLQFESGSIEGTKLRRSDSVREAETRQPLDPASLAHVQRLFRQLLSDADIPNCAAWEKSLIPILSHCTDDVDLDVRNGDDMDIRHFVKMKKIPGGRTSDTAYVQGIVFTKNLALKSMPRKIFNEPKIVLVSFAIEYQRHPEQHFMSLQPVIEQEKEYLRKVVNRIIALRPQVLLVEKSVAGVALQMLAEANIAVAYNVKASVIEAVSRIADTDIVSSLDMLALPIRVGVSKRFEVKTFVNNETKGQKKTYIFITGMNPKLGCTIALRGATNELLSQVKKITEFMVYVVYNVKLERCLMRDAYVQLDNDGTPTPSLKPALLVSPSTGSGSSGLGSDMAASNLQTPSDRGGQTDGGLQGQEDANLDKILTVETVVSDKTTNPGPMHQSHSHVSQDNQLPEDIPMPTYYSDMVAKYKTRVLSASPLVKFSQPYLLMRAREQERRVVYLKRLRDQDIVDEYGENEKAKPRPFQLIKPEMVHEIGQKAPRQIMEVLHAVHDAEYDKALHNYQTQTRQWETNIQDSLDLFDPFSHQNIVVLYSVVCTSSKIPCIEPSLVTIEFYNQYADENVDSDCTLGQYIEDLCQGADSVCTVNGCYTPLCHHHRTYVHDQARITVFVEHDTPIPDAFRATKREADEENGIIMWSYCKSCKMDFGGLRMSPSAWKYSFGKFLELSFLGKGMKLHKDSGCPHDHPRDHLRYFAFHSNIVRMHHDPIDLYEIIVPRARITWKVDHDLKLKNDIFTKAEDRWNRFMESVKARIKSIKIDTNVLPEKAESCKTELDRLSKKVQEDQPRLVQNLQEAYMNSKYYEVIPLNAVVREMLREAAEWDAAFAKFEAEYLSDKDVRQLAIIQLKKFFTDNESKESLPASDGTSMASDSVEDKTPFMSQTDASESEKMVSQPSQPAEDETAAQAQGSTTGTGEASLEGSGETAVEAQVDGAEEPKNGEESEVADQAAEILERVEPLDLATPTSPLLVKTDPILQQANPEGSNELMAPVVRAEPVPLPIAAPAAEMDPPDVISSGKDDLTLSEKVEKLRREQHRAASHDVSSIGAGGEPDVPRPIPDRVSSRRAGLNVSPPIMRALSQPAGALPRTASSIGKLLKDPKGQETSEILARIGAADSIKGDKKFSDRIGLGALKTHRKAAASAIPRYVHGGPKKKESKVSNLARHFEQLSREFEKERIRDRKQRAATLQSSRAFLPRTSTKAIVEVYEDVDQAVQEPGPSEEDHLQESQQSDPKSEDTSKSAATTAEEPSDKAVEKGDGSQPDLPSQTPHPEEHATGADADHDNRQESQPGSDDECGGSDADQSSLTFEEVLSDVKEIAESLEPSGEIPEELPKHQKKSVMNLLTNFWAERSASNWPPLEYPLNAGDHIFLDSDVIIREDEPSSVIAFALSSNDYQARLRDIRQQWNVEADGDVGVEDSDSGLEMKGPTRASSARGWINEKELENSLKRPTTTHLKYQFFDRSAKMLCKVFYAEQFDALRQKCGVADRIIESLSRCLKWDSKGGKTKSVFLKTLDDRIVMKSLSPIETSAFLRFAPAYFSIMAEALFYDLPSVIAKMLGFFQVVIKNPDTNTEIKLDLLVMENLFYDRSPSRTFDLKGSMRNRKIQSTGEQNEVLLDENMVEYIYESPLFAREHAKRLLRASVWNDTLFLARQNVMDYSLMIAVDETKKELVVGIIDCIRTYTWDKRLESWIKDRGFAGGGRNRPTVTSPKEYKSRFREAMARYILQSPNCWHPFGKGHAKTNASGTPKTRFEGDTREP